MKYYVYYLVIDQTGTVIYVGKGSGQRMYWHAKAFKSKRWSRWPLYRRIKERVIDRGLTFSPRIVYKTDDELDAYSEEMRRIAFIGLDRLYNVLPGGVPTKAEIGAAISLSLKAYTARCRMVYGQGMPPEVAAKIGTANTGQTRSQEFVDGIRERHASGAMDHVHKAFTDAGRKAQSERGFSTAHRKALSDARKGKPHPCKPTTQPRKKVAGKKYKGVSRHKSGMFVARITRGGKLTFLGSRALEDHAAILYDNASEELYATRPNATVRGICHQHASARPQF